MPEDGVVAALEPQLPPIQYLHNFQYKHYYIVQNRDVLERYYLYVLMYEPNSLRMENNNIVAYQKYGKVITSRVFTYEVGQANWQNSSNTTIHNYMDITDALLYNNFAIDFGEKEYKKNPMPEDGVVSALGPQYPKIPTLHNFQYKHYYIVQNRDALERYYLYVLMYEPNSLQMQNNTMIPYQQYGKEIHTRVFAYDVGQSSWQNYTSGYTVHNYVDMADALLYNNFTISFNGLNYGKNPMPEDGVAPVPEPQFPKIPTLHNVQYKHYYIVQDKNQLEVYHLFLLMYDPVSLQLSDSDWICAYQKYDKVIRCEEYLYTIGKETWNYSTWHSNVFQSYLNFRDALMYNNFSMSLGREYYKANPLPEDGIVAALEPEYPKIPDLHNFRNKHYYIAQNKNQLESYQLYLFAYEPVFFEINTNGWINAQQEYGKPIRCEEYRYTIGGESWSYSTWHNSVFQNYSEFEDALIHNNYPLRFSDQYYGENPISGDDSTPAIAVDLPQLPTVVTEDISYRDYMIFQNPNALESYTLYLFEKRPVDYVLTGTTYIKYLDGEEQNIRVMLYHYTAGEKEWNFSTSYSNLTFGVATMSESVVYHNFDILITDSSSNTESNILLKRSRISSYLSDTYTGWYEVVAHGKSCAYYYVNGKKQHGWMNIDGNEYFLNGPDNWARVENASITTVRLSKTRSEDLPEKAGVYYFGKGGSMATGIQEINGDVYEFDKQGEFIRVISGTSVYRAKATGDIKYKPGSNESTRFYYAKDERVKTVIPKAIQTIDGANWIRVSYTAGTTTRYVKYGWVLESNLEKWTGKSYIFYMPPNDSATKHDKKEIADFFGYENPDEQVVLMQLDENSLLVPDANGKTNPHKVFAEMWNNMDDSVGIDTVFIMVHGSPKGMSTEFTYSNKQWRFFDEGSYAHLEGKNIKLLFLHVCTVSQYGWNIIASDENTIAKLFGQKPGIVRTVGPTTIIEAGPPANNERPFWATLNGKFILYTKGVNDVKVKKCEKGKYKAIELLEEVFLEG